MADTDKQTVTGRVQAYVDVYDERMARPNSSYDGHIHSFGLADGEVKLTVQDLRVLLKLAQLTDRQIRAAEQRGAQELRSTIVCRAENGDSADTIVEDVERGDL